MNFIKNMCVKVAFYLILSCIISTFSFASILPMSPKVKTEARIAELERAISALEAGMPLSPQSEAFLFPEEFSDEDCGVFWALNYKDRRIRRLRALIAQSDFSETRKKRFLLKTTGRVREQYWEDVFSGNAELPVFLSSNDWDDQFVEKSDAAAQKQIAELKAFRRDAESYRTTLSSNDLDEEELLRRKELVMTGLAHIFRGKLPCRKETADACGKIFFEEIFPVLEDIREREQALSPRIIEKTDKITSRYSSEIDGTDSYLVDFIFAQLCKKEN